MGKVIDFENQKKANQSAQKDRESLLKYLSDTMDCIPKKTKDLQVKELQEEIDLEKWALVEYIRAVYKFHKACDLSRKELWRLSTVKLRLLEQELLKEMGVE